MRLRLTGHPTETKPTFQNNLASDWHDERTAHTRCNVSLNAFDQETNSS